MTYWYIAAVLDLALALLGIALTLKKRVPPRPGERETRFRQSRDRTMNHPREDSRHV